MGFIFQNFNLLPQISALENVELPMLLGGLSRRKRKTLVGELLERVGLGGQMQRVAIARAMAMDPDIILADEPTGNLDSSSGGDIMTLFKELWKQGRTVPVITHDPALARLAPRQVEIHDGLIRTDGRLAA